MIGLFCRRALQKRQYSANETYNLIDPANRSHPITYLLSTFTHIYYTHLLHYQLAENLVGQTGDKIQEMVNESSTLSKILKSQYYSHFKKNTLTSEKN